MTSFINDVLISLQKKEVDFSQLTFILPSKRAGNFLKHELSKLVSQTIFAPEILSIEEFVEELSQLKQITNTELLFKFYEIYLKITPKENIESFDTFSKWAQIILQDFNEIDRYLIPQEQIFDYLNAIQETNHWSLESNQTPLIKNYLLFWKQLKQYYKNLSDVLITTGIGYQGLIYRESVENLENYIQANSRKQHIFIGFNALNTAESTIIQELLHNQLAEIYWDTDITFFNAKNHDASLFLKQHKVNWKYFYNNPFNWLADNYSKEKNISVVGVPKNIGQAKYIGNILEGFKKVNPTLNNTAIVLSDENLLIPVLNSIPNSIDALNITMGFPLKSIPLASLFEQLFQLQMHHTDSLYYKDVIAIISHPFVRPLYLAEGEDNAEKIIDSIRTNNFLFISTDKLKELSKENLVITSLLFNTWKNDSNITLQQCLKLMVLMKERLDLDKDKNLLSLEYLYRFNEVFNMLNTLNVTYKYATNIRAIYTIYKELLSSETLDFQGKPLQGLQIMGMLESRVLDFETVIISSVNEGILPSGKSNNSFIPFDVKLENGLPTYKEKDAVYTYHFYRLIQRAKNVYVLYNTEPDVLNGNEKSRFITQLEIEGIHKLNQTIITPKTPQIKKFSEVILKNESVLKKIRSLALKGFSPSSLSNYIRNPIDFYYQKILGIREEETVEEVVAANTLGTVIHNTLEDFYKPIEGHFLTIDHLDAMHLNINKMVTHHFKTIYKEGTLTQGKNLIIFEIAKRYISNFLNTERDHIKKGNTIKIIEIETDLQIPISIPELNFPITVNGKVDRVDEFNGKLRIIDYKSGKVEQGKVEIVNWEDITTDYDKYSKSFQILMYAFMMHKRKSLNFPIEVGIISFKNLNAGFLKFAKKDRLGAHAKKDFNITSETLDAFYNELKALIIEICNPNIDFIEKEL
ncbi:PD-(D/E)XK nuclease family protein [Flavobacteriaceae bacterium AU392]|nr:PD-(D/E)XK nuclease family protein [Flavobacteriaceae bacterium]RKM84741.1 PD-(D/E)XK nuclease family protein [Flavobacteriaceae bacterium AU392]